MNQIYIIVILTVCAMACFAQVVMNGVSISGVESNPRQFILNTSPVAVWDTTYGAQVGGLGGTNVVGLVDLSYNGNDLNSVTNSPYFFSSATTNNVPCVSFTQAINSGLMFNSPDIAKYFNNKNPWTFITLQSAHTNANSVLWQANWGSGTNGSGGRIEFRPVTGSSSALIFSSNTNQATPVITGLASTTDKWFYSTCRFTGTVADIWVNQSQGNSLTSPGALTANRFVIGMGQNAGASTFNMRWNGYWRLGILYSRSLTDAEIVSVVSNCNIYVQQCY